MLSFRQLHSHLKRLSQNDLQGSRTESGFKRAFATLSGQDTETSTGTMFLNVEQLEKQLEKEDFQEIGSMDAFNAIPEFHDTLIQHLESVKKSIDEKVQLKREYDSWVNERQMQKTEEKVDMSKALDASSVNTKCKPMAEVQTTAEINVFAIGQHHTEQPEFNNEGEEREAAFAKPHRMIASSNSKISSKNMTRFSSNDMVHNHYLEEAKKRTQERSRNLEPSLLPSTRLQSMANEHSRNSRNFPDSKHFVCSTCQKCIFSANHDSCLTKLLNEVNSRAKVPSNKTPKRNKPVEQISVSNKQERQIPIGQRFSIQKTSVVQKKTMPPRSCLRWKPMGKIFKTVGLRWVPTGKIFTSSKTKVDSEPLNGSNADITNQYECEQTLDVSAELRIHDHSTEPSSSKLVPNVVPSACKSATTRKALELLFHHHITMLRSTFLRYDGDECDKGRMLTNIELTLEQSQQGVSNDVLVSIEGVEELKRNAWIKDGNPSRVIIKQALGRSYALSWKPGQGDSLNPPDHSVSSILVGIIPLTHSSPSYLRTAISNYEVSLGRSIRF
nr:hypothetical protein [Tanacetum cinerariifolium]